MIDKESERLLIQQATQHNREAFTTLYDIYIDRIYKHVFFRAGNQNATEDITQEVFIRAWKAIPKYKDKGIPLIAWLIAIADNLLADFYNDRKKCLIVESCAQIDSTDSPETINIRKIYIRDAISKLKDEKQKVILMHFIEGFSYHEIAKLLNKSEGAIRIIQYRALRDLREILGLEKVEANEEREYSH